MAQTVTKSRGAKAAARQAAVEAVKGKYRGVSTSSSAYAARKKREIEAENRSR